MFFWLREVVGWALLAAGVFIIWMGVGLLQGVEPRHIEGAALCGTGIMVMRLAVALIRVSTAARIVTVPKAAAVKESK